MKTLTENTFFLRKVERSSGRIFSMLGLPRGNFRWLLLPVLFLFLTLQIAFLKVTVFTPLLPLLSFFCFFLSLFYKTKGLVISYLSLLFIVLSSYKELAPEENLWQMGVIFTLAIDFFITLLAIEDLEEEEVVLQKKNEENEQHLFELKGYYLREEGKYNDYIDSLKETVQELTHDAEQRRIESVVHQNTIERLENKIGVLVEERRVAALLEPKILPLQNETLLERLIEAERLYKQMRMQFEEKKSILDKTREELFATQTALLAFEREERGEECALSIQEMERLLIVALEEQAALEEEIFLLERNLINSD